MSPKATLAASLVFLVVLATAGVAGAKGPDLFREHVDKATKLYNAEQYEEAIKELQTAYALRQLPRLLLNIGQAYRKLGRAKDALGFYEFYLRVEPNPKPEVKQELQSFITQTRAMLEAAQRMKAQQEAEEKAREREKENEERAARGEPPLPPDQPAEPAKEPAKEPVKEAPPPPKAPVAPGPDLSAPHPVATGPVVVAEAPRKTSRPVYKQWWLWTAVGVVVAGAVVTGVVLGTRGGPADPSGIDIRDQRF